ncbi:MAG: hypothetical protein IT208_15075 [Chthonomonadales bacterium]|nr:hypothetical protein [Chthonomonadales bacterium]
MRLAKESWLLVLIGGADLVSTLWLVRAGQAVEANPLMGYFLDRGVLPFVAAKMVLLACPLAVLEVARRRRPRFVTSMLRLGIVLYVGFYSAVVWHTNAPRGERRYTEEQRLAVVSWAESPPTAAEMAMVRARWGTDGR